MSSSAVDVLIVGVGNTLRGDDGAGQRVIDLIRARGNIRAELRAVHQLHVELLEDVLSYKTVIVVDAALDQREVTLRRVTSADSSRLSSSHHLGLEKFLVLSRTVYGRDVDLWVCSVPGRDFDMKEGLTPETERFSRQAADRIVDHVKGWTHA